MVTEGYITTLGMLQLNAALYFWVRFSVFEQFYWPLDVMFGLVYTVRVTYFFLWYANDTVSTRNAYNDWFQYTSYLLALFVVALIVQKTVEWGHVPAFETTGWSLCGLINWYNWTQLSEFNSQTSGLRLQAGRDVEHVELIHEKAI